MGSTRSSTPLYKAVLQNCVLVYGYWATVWTQRKGEIHVHMHMYIHAYVYVYIWLNLPLKLGAKDLWWDLWFLHAWVVWNWTATVWGLCSDLCKMSLFLCQERWGRNTLTRYSLQRGLKMVDLEFYVVISKLKLEVLKNLGKLVLRQWTVVLISLEISGGVIC